MKKIWTLSFFLVLSVCCLAQTDSLKLAKKTDVIAENGKNEIKINLLTTILGLAEINYERILPNNTGLGLGVMFSLEKEMDLRLVVIPHYRIYFSAKKGSGFFIEANAAVLSLQEWNNNYTVEPNGNYYYQTTNNYVYKTKFGLGAAAGAKFLTKNGFIGEVYLGAGRIFNEQILQAYPRLGITLGKRF